MNWTFKTFDQLTNNELYYILKARVDIFIVEQNSPYKDMDGVDQDAMHLFLENQGKIIAYARIIPKGVLYKQPSIGRIVVDNQHRKSGYGRLLLQKSINWIEKNWGKQEIYLHAQVYLRDFYRSFGFEEISDSYEEDGIPHVDMIRTVPE
ncbi:protein ElaA [Paraliobacillus ryukyuensis]|uniref:ElaA protein n=1 Tax=Paraliobacillus ryukyuensis TaxID=200904 RepID=A0A366EBH8_9BACI|nr:GNAT family N-acetyltransferase [Paraliobacillus ryukyuensis]RBO99726.1 ElaA protein [Paraliobacillus ryukyuensis]